MRDFFHKCKELSGTAVLVLLLAAGCLWKYQEYSLGQAQQQIAGKILRFHVRANSNSRADQELKLKVRDAVGAYMQEELAGIEDLGQCSEAVQSRLAQIVHMAEQVIAEEGYTYPVTARVGNEEFPQKTYGEYTFPPGEYKSLSIVIGSGKGQNWWCVMYPNMCFHDAVYEVVDEKAKQSLQKVLSEDEYDAVLKSGRYKVRFKYLSFLNDWLGK